MRRFALAVAMLPMLAGAAGAMSCDGVSVPDSATVGGSSLVLNGAGIRKATFLKVHVYVAGLYLPAKAASADAIIAANGPWRLDLHFVRDVGASDIREAWSEGFGKAGGANAALVGELNAKMVDFAKGHVLGFIHEPGKGVALNVNGTAVPALGGPEFAAALLKVIIGAEPPNSELKVGLLGGACS